MIFWRSVAIICFPSGELEAGDPPPRNGNASLPPDGGGCIGKVPFGRFVPFGNVPSGSVGGGGGGGTKAPPPPFFGMPAGPTPMPGPTMSGGGPFPGSFGF